MFKVFSNYSWIIACTLIGFVQKSAAQSEMPKGDTTKRVFSATVTITEIMDSAFQVHYDTTIVENNDLVNFNKRKFQTNWLIFDLGFANFNDRTPYGSIAANEYLYSGNGVQFAKSDMRLRTIKSSNVNIWLFMQKYSLYKNRLNLKYGFGFEMFNFRYQNNITYHNNPNYIYRDTLSFQKNKLYASYFSIPLMLNYDPTPGAKWGFSASAGIQAGYRVGGHTKQKSSDRGVVKQGGSFDLNDWRLAYTAELGVGLIRLYGTYSIRPLQNNVMDQHPYAIGMRISYW